MSHLEERLRTMLRERAGDVTEVPAHVLALPSSRSAGHRRTAWLVAAAVAVVLAVAAAVVAVSGNRDRSEPAATQAVTASPSTTPSPRPSTANAHAERQARLSWFGMRDVPGFDQHDWRSLPGVRTLGLRARSDPDLPVNCNGCAIVSDWVLVFDGGRFAAERRGITGWAKTTVGGHRAYLGAMVVYGSRRATKVPTLAWSYRPGAWAMVQGVTALGGRAATLRQLAEASRPTVDNPIELPFRLDTVVPGAITSVDDDRGAGYAFVLEITGPTMSMDVTLWPGRSLTGRFETSSATRELIGGRPGWYDPDQGFAVAFHGELAVVGVSVNEDDTGGDPTTTARQNAERQVLLRKIMTGLRWANGDGRPPYLTAEQAIP